jgi:uncharacterized protein
MIDLLGGIAVGFIGSMHCIGMCGPIAIALPVTPGGRFVTGRLLYNAGRVVTYVGLGALVGSLGGAFVLAGMQQGVSIAVGGVMLFVVILPSLSRRLSARLPVAHRAHELLRARFLPLFARRSLPALFGIGILNGLLPCGFVYVALGTAMTLGGVERGVVFLAGFGIGTIPAMFVISVVGKQLQAGAKRFLGLALPLFTGLLALLLILRGLNLGIPYVSPRVPGTQTHGEGTSCCGGETELSSTSSASPPGTSGRPEHQRAAARP